MTVYVLGAGASKHAGYPLASEMGVRLFEWMKEQVGSERNYPAVADLLEQAFGQCDDIEDLLTRAQQLIDEAPRLAESLNKRFGPCKGIKTALLKCSKLFPANTKLGYRIRAYCDPWSSNSSVNCRNTGARLVLGNSFQARS